MKKFAIFTFLLIAVTAAALRFGNAQQQVATPASEDAASTAQKPTAQEVTSHDAGALELIRQSRTALFNYESLQANLHQRVNLGNYKFTASGSYSAASGFRSRLQYNVELGEMEGHFIEVSDGQILHTRREVGPREIAGKSAGAMQVELARRDIQKILQETQKQLELAEPQASQAMQAAEIGIGGLPAILASLERMFFFESVKDDTIGGQQVRIVQGRQNSARVGELGEEYGAIAAQVAQLMPDLVRITLLADSLFPMRIQYLKQVDAEKNIYQPLLTLEFSEIRINQPLPAREFSYTAQPGIEEKDETPMFLETILGQPKEEEAQPEPATEGTPAQN